MDRKHLIWAALLLLFLFGFFLRAYPLDMHAGWDESAYFLYAEHIRTGHSNYSEMNIRPPVLPIIIYALSFISSHPFFIGAVLAFMAALIIPASYLIGVELKDEYAGLFAALIVAVHPVFVKWGHYVLTDALVATFAAFSLYFVLKDKVLISGLLMGVAAITKFSALAPFGIVGAYLLWKDWKEAIKYGLAGLIPISAFMVWSKLAFGDFTSVFQNALNIVGPAPAGLEEFLMVFALPILFGLALHYIFSQNKQHSYSIMAFAWPVIIIGVMGLGRLEPRYALITVVPLIPLAGAGLSNMERYGKYALLGMALFIIVNSSPAYDHLERKSVSYYLPPAAEAAMNAPLDSELPIYATTQYPIWGWYSNNRVIAADGRFIAKYYPRNLREEGYVVIYDDFPPETEWVERQRELGFVYRYENIALYHYQPRIP